MPNIATKWILFGGAFIIATAGKSTQLEFFEQMRNTAAEMGVDFDADAVAEAARNITAADDEPEGRNRKERRWFGKKKK